MWRFWRRKSKPHFETQYDDLLPVMYLAANKILHNAQDAEDAVQEALAVMCEKFTENSQNGCPKMPGYAVTICERKAIDIYRQKKRHVPLLEELEAVAPDYFDALLQAAAAGLGLAVLSRQVAAEAIAQGKVGEVAVEGLVFRRQFRVVWHREKVLSPLARDLLQVVLDQAAPGQGRP